MGQVGVQGTKRNIRGFKHLNTVMGLFQYLFVSKIDGSHSQTLTVYAKYQHTDCIQNGIENSTKFMKWDELPLSNLSLYIKLPDHGDMYMKKANAHGNVC